MAQAAVYFYALEIRGWADATGKVLEKWEA